MSVVTPVRLFDAVVGQVVVVMTSVSRSPVFRAPNNTLPYNSVHSTASLPPPPHLPCPALPVAASPILAKIPCFEVCSPSLTLCQSRGVYRPCYDSNPLRAHRVPLSPNRAVQPIISWVTRLVPSQEEIIGATLPRFPLLLPPFSKTPLFIPHLVIEGRPSLARHGDRTGLRSVSPIPSRPRSSRHGSRCPVTWPCLTTTPHVDLVYSGHPYPIVADHSDPNSQPSSTLFPSLASAPNTLGPHSLFLARNSRSAKQGFSDLPSNCPPFNHTPCKSTTGLPFPSKGA
ncbi:hypothetical protein B0H67DRAFT_170970 [Lasiosphaeris hirsuta]|uniref:Uncharacterized protein n=1 Tax=Lasiosphaeris hirsuta TaxID=260670 RepID=A0AA40AQ38_9PEZI|nr:hypothetical protein B0H67DRAFT_170970 [Lasiosphaeris hirsuta]